MADVKLSLVSKVPLLPGGESSGKIDDRARRNISELLRSTWDSGNFCMAMAVIGNTALWLALRRLSFTTVPAFEALFFRSVVGALVTFISTFFSDSGPLFGNPHFRKLMAIRACTISVAMMMVYSAIYLLPIGDVSALQQLAVVFVAVFGWISGWDAMNMWIGVGSLTCSVGAVLVSRPDFLFREHGETWTSERSYGVGLTVCSAVLFAVSNSIVGKIGEGTSAMSLTMWFYCGGMVTGIVPLLLSFPTPPLIKLSQHEAFLLVTTTTFAVTAQIYLTRGFQLCNATKGVALQTSIVIFCYLFGFLFLGEQLSWVATTGAILTMLGVLSVAEGKGRAELVEMDKENKFANSEEIGWIEIH